MIPFNSCIYEKHTLNPMNRKIKVQRKIPPPNLCNPEVVLQEQNQTCWIPELQVFFHYSGWNNPVRSRWLMGSFQKRAEGEITLGGNEIAE